MGKNVVFLIHGVGRHGDDWASLPGGPIDTLKTAVDRYPSLRGQDLDELIEFVPIRYDDIFDRILHGWDDLATGLGAAGELVPGTLGKAVDYMTTLGDDHDEFLAFGGDVMLYRGFRLFRQRVLLRVIRSIVDKIAERWLDDDPGLPRFTVVAHSLGTTVAHDALHHLGTQSWREPYDFEEDAERAEEEADSAADSEAGIARAAGKPNPLSAGDFRFETIFMLANTSGLLFTTPVDPLHSIVRPVLPGGPPGYTKRLYNVAHVADPIPAVRSVSVPASWTSPSETALDIRLNHFYEKNVHGFGHYLLHPDVHGRVLFYAVERWRPSPADLAVWAQFPRIGGAMESQVAELERKLGDLVRDAPQLAKLRAFAELIADLRGLVGGAL